MHRSLSSRNARADSVRRLGRLAIIGILASGCGAPEQAPIELDDSTGSANVTAEVDSAELPMRDTTSREVDSARSLPREGSDSSESRQSPPNRPVWIEGGTFVMGQDSTYASLGSAHEVTMSSFWIQEHEVTSAEYRGFDPTHRSVSGPDAHPVVYVQWREAMAYAESLGGSLPTEAQWEYAARGQEGRTYPWGEAPPTCERAHYGDCEPRGTIPVMSLPAGATPDGIHNLAGNVFEWVFDRYGRYGSRAAVDPTGPDVGEARVLRGGGWLFDTVYVRGAARTSWPEVNTPEVVDEMPYIGFRVAWPGDVDPPPPLEL